MNRPERAGTKARRRAKFPLLVLLVLAAGGCWDLEEVDRRAFATTIGIDLDARGRTVLSVQLPIAEKMLPPGSTAAGGNRGKTFDTLRAAGETARAAFGTLQTETYRRLVIQQNKTIVFGEAAARAGVTPRLDWLTRSPKAPPQALIFVADRRSAAEIVAFSPTENTLPGLGFIQSSQTEDKYDQAYYIPAWLFAQKLADSAEDPYAPLIGLDERQGRFVQAGEAVFSGDRLAGKLSPAETRCFGILAGLMRGGLLTVPHSAGESLTLHNVRAKTGIKVTLAAGRPRFDLTVRLQGILSELTSGRTRLTPADRRAFARDVASYLRPRLEAIIRKLQAWNADAIGWGEQLRAQHEEVWEKIDWGLVYPRASFSLAVQVRIGRDGVF